MLYKIALYFLKFKYIYQDFFKYIQNYNHTEKMHTFPHLITLKSEFIILRIHEIDFPKTFYLFNN